MTDKTIDKKAHAFTHACTLLPDDAHWYDPITPDMALHIEAEAVRQYADKVGGVAGDEWLDQLHFLALGLVEAVRPLSPDKGGDALAALMAYARQRIQPAERANGAPDGWALAEKVRVDLDKKSCPDAFMRIAVESIVKHFAAPTQSTQQPDAESKP